LKGERGHWGNILGSAPNMPQVRYLIGSESESDQSYLI
jgi:hypothetical protein